MILILDSSIIQRDFLLRSSLFEAFLRYMLRTHSRVVLPQLVVDEVIANYEREFRGRLKTVARDYGHLAAIDLSPLDPLPQLNVSEAVTSYRTHLLRTFSLHEKDLYQFKPHYLAEAVRRAINRVAPCTDRGEQIRDCLLWLMAMDVAREHPDEPIVLLSGDKGAFADADGALLSPLAEEIADANLKLSFFSSLERFARDHASRIEFVTRDWVNQQLDPDTILRAVEDRLEQSLTLKMPSLPYHDKFYTGDAHVTGGGVELDDLYVNELDEAVYRVEARYVGEVEFEVQVSRSGGRDIGFPTGTSGSSAAVEVLPTSFSSGPLFSPRTQYSYERVYPEVELVVELVVREGCLSDWQVIDFSLGSPWR